MLIDELKNRRPNLSDSSLRTYNTTLSSLFKKMNPEAKEINIKFFENQDKVIDFLKDIPSNKRKSVLAALVVISDKNDKYKKLMTEDAEKTKTDINKNEKTEYQKDNWIDSDEIKKIHDGQLTEFKNLVKQYKINNNLSMAQYQKMQDFIIVLLTSGLYMEPRRLLDWVAFKTKNINPEIDNFLDVKKKQFIFNKFKTVKFNKDNKALKIENPEVLRLLKQWIKINPTDYLLFDSNQNPLTSIKLNQRLNRIYGKKRSVNIIRHSFLSEKYKDMPKIEDMEKTAKAMGHSVNQALEYVKH